MDLVTLANNHILDFGPEGITDSIKALDGAGIRHVGAGENREQAERLEILEVNGKRIGFLGTSRVYMSADWAAGPEHPGVFSTYDPARAVEAIKTARGQCDYLVVYVHWGVERETEPKDYQRAMGHQYIDAGADLVIGSHPHVLQPVEYYNGKPIVYSLGNFVFGSSIPSTILFKVVLDGGGDPGDGDPMYLFWRIHTAEIKSMQMKTAGRQRKERRTEHGTEDHGNTGRSPDHDPGRSALGVIGGLRTVSV